MISCAKTGAMYKPTTVRKDFAEEVEVEQLLRVRHTGEVLKYGSSKFICNWRFRITDIRGNSWGSYNLNELQLVDVSGSVLKEWLEDK